MNNIKLINIKIHSKKPTRKYSVSQDTLFILQNCIKFNYSAHNNHSFLGTIILNR